MIGKGGSIIKHIREFSGARATIEERNHNGRNHTHTLICSHIHLLICMAINCYECFAVFVCVLDVVNTIVIVIMILNAIVNGIVNVIANVIVNVIVFHDCDCDCEQVGAVIGKGGSIIKHVQEFSGERETIEERNHNGRNYTHSFVHTFICSFVWPSTATSVFPFSFVCLMLCILL